MGGSSLICVCVGRNAPQLLFRSLLSDGWTVTAEKMPLAMRDKTISADRSMMRAAATNLDMSPSAKDIKYTLSIKAFASPDMAQVIDNVSFVPKSAHPPLSEERTHGCNYWQLLCDFRSGPIYGTALALGGQLQINKTFELRPLYDFKLIAVFDRFEIPGSEDLLALIEEPNLLYNRRFSLRSFYECEQLVRESRLPMIGEGVVLDKKVGVMTGSLCADCSPTNKKQWLGFYQPNSRLPLRRRYSEAYWDSISEKLLDQHSSHRFALELFRHYYI